MTPYASSGSATPRLRRRHLCTGLVLDVSKSGSGGFGSDAKTSVATVIVPQAIADQVLGGTGIDELGLALIGRGVGVDEAEIVDLSGGRR